MPCDKIDCQLKIECFDAYGKFKYPPCASESVGLAATDSQQLKAKISTLIAEIYGNKPADRVYSREEVIDYLQRDFLRGFHE